MFNYSVNYVIFVFHISQDKINLSDDIKIVRVDYLRKTCIMYI